MEEWVEENGWMIMTHLLNEIIGKIYTKIEGKKRGKTAREDMIENISTGRNNRENDQESANLKEINFPSLPISPIISPFYSISHQADTKIDYIIT